MIPDDHPEAKPLHTAVGRALGAWAIVENVIGTCYAYCVIEGTFDEAKRDFWAKKSFDQKRKAANKVIKSSIGRWHVGIADWETLHQRLIDQSNERNKLAHGSVYFDQGSWCVTPYYFARVDALDPSECRGPKERLALADIDSIRFRFIDLTDDLVQFGVRIRQRMKYFT